jgi:hypothetical protein
VASSGLAKPRSGIGRPGSGALHSLLASGGRHRSIPPSLPRRHSPPSVEQPCDRYAVAACLQAPARGRRRGWAGGGFGLARWLAGGAQDGGPTLGTTMATMHCGCTSKALPRRPKMEAGPWDVATQAYLRGRPLSLQLHRSARVAWARVDATAATGSGPVWPLRSLFPSTLIAASLVGRWNRR